MIRFTMIHFAFKIALATVLVAQAWANCSTVTMIDLEDCAEDGIEKLMFEISLEVNEKLCPTRRSLRSKSDRALFNCNACPWCEMVNHRHCISFCEASCYRMLTGNLDDKSMKGDTVEVTPDKAEIEGNERSLLGHSGDMLLDYGFTYVSVESEFNRDEMFDSFISENPELRGVESCRRKPIFVMHNENAAPPCCTRNFQDCYKGSCSDSEESCGKCGKAEWMQPQSNCVPLGKKCSGTEDCCQNPAKTVTCDGNGNSRNKKCGL